MKNYYDTFAKEPGFFIVAFYVVVNLLRDTPTSHGQNMKLYDLHNFNNSVHFTRA